MKKYKLPDVSPIRETIRSIVSTDEFKPAAWAMVPMIGIIAIKYLPLTEQVRSTAENGLVGLGLILCNTAIIAINRELDKSDFRRLSNNLMLSTLGFNCICIAVLGFDVLTKFSYHNSIQRIVSREINFSGTLMLLGTLSTLLATKKITKESFKNLFNRNSEKE